MNLLTDLRKVLRLAPRILCGLVALVALCATARAQTNEPAAVRRVSLQECIELALKYNLDLKVDRLGYEVAVYTLRGAYGVYDPVVNFTARRDHNEGTTFTEQFPTRFGTNVTITQPAPRTDDVALTGGVANSVSGATPWGMTYNFQGSLSETRSESFFPSLNPSNGPPVVFVPTTYQHASSTVSASATQPLLKNFWIDSGRLAIRVDKISLKKSEWLLKLQIIQTITKLEQAYYDLIYDRENVVVQEKALEAAQRLVTENRKKVEVGALAPLDLNSAESQAAASEADLIAARSTVAAQEATVRALIAGNYRELAGFAIEPSEGLTAPRQAFSRQDSWLQGLTKRSELVQAKLDVEKQGLQLKYDKNQLLPEVDLVGTYGYNGAGVVFSDAIYDVEQTHHAFWTFGGNVTIPLSRVTQRNAYRSDKAQMEANVFTVKRWERDIMAAIDTDIRTAQSSYEQVGARRRAREFAEADLDAEQKKLDSGKSTPYTVLLKQRDLTTARGAEIQALDNYNKNLSQLSQDEGTTLERLNVRFEVR